MPRRRLERVLHLAMNGRAIGTLTSAPGGRLSLRYTREWLEDPAATPISLRFPLSPDPYGGEDVASYFDNLLPDGDPIRRRMQRSLAAESTQPFDLLAGAGADCVGALQLLRTPEIPDVRRVVATKVCDADIARLLRGHHEHPLGMAPEEDDFRISLAGAQEKTAYLRRDGVWLRPLGLTPTTHIFKRPLGLLHDNLDMRDSVENEFLCLRLAAELGLPVAQAAIETFEDQTVLVVERFDRRDRPSGGILRLPQEDFLQALGLESAQKYQQHGGPGMADCLRLLEGSMSRAADTGLFLKAQLVFWMIAAIDGHAKNFSIFHEPGGFHMTPLYDVLSAAPPHLHDGFRRRELQLAMSAGAGRHYRLDQLHPRHFDETAERARVPLETRRRAIAELAEAGMAAFERAGDGLPPGFPDRVATPILDYGRNRMEVLTAFVDRMQAKR